MKASKCLKTRKLGKTETKGKKKVPKVDEKEFFNVHYFLTTWVSNFFHLPIISHL